MTGEALKVAVQLTDRYDVLIAGGGTAGVIAAIASARAGARTALVEQSGMVGGVAAVGCMPFLSFYSSLNERIIRGIPWELVSRLMEMGCAFETRNLRLGDPTAEGPVRFSQGGIQYSPEAYRFVALEMLRDAGVDLMLHTYVSEVLAAGSEVEGVLAHNKSGTTELRAPRVIDCTGDADVAVKAGTPFEKGRASDGLMQPLTLMFIMSNVNLKRAEESTALRWPWEAVLEPWRSKYGQYTIRLQQWMDDLEREFADFEVKPLEFLLFDLGDGVFYCGNRLHIAHVDATDAQQLTRAEIEGRRLAWRITEFTRQHVPGFENAHLVSTAPHIGIRETRRIMGDYYVTLEDVLGGRRFEDVVGLCGYWPDIHDYKGASKFHMPVENVEVRGGSYDIPYRCMLPRGVENLLVAGRCVSASHEASGSIRAMGAVMAMGQAAGTAAALSLRHGMPPRSLDPALLQEELLREGAWLGERFVRHS